MTTEQMVAAFAGLAAIVASLATLAVTRPRPRTLLEVLYLALPVLGAIALVAAVRAAL